MAENIKLATQPVVSATISALCNFVKGLYPGQGFIPLHEPRLIGKERDYVLDAIDSTFVSSVGKYVDQFEAMVKEYTGAASAVAVVNGTAALHIALLLAGVEKGSLVITQPFSFIATCNAISYIGADPVFVDIDKNTLGLSADALQAFLEEYAEVKQDKCYHKITGQRIAACVPMHSFGHPVEIDRVVEVCNKYHIALVEDAAESIGSTYKGKQTGTFGQLGTFSFNGNKTITCGGGGIIVTNNIELGKMAKHLTTQAKVPHRWDFVHDHIGYNYRMPNLNAAMACAQLEQLDKFITNKRELALLYKTHLQNQNEISFVTEPEGAISNYWLNAILCKDRAHRDAVLCYANDNCVMTRPSWQLMHKLVMFENCLRAELPIAEWIEERLINIPSSVRL
jgi:perosamine synthetase